MIKTSTQRMREKAERDDYCKDDSMILVNRSFIQRCSELLKGTIEGSQLENLVTKARERIKSEQFLNTFDRPIKS